MTIKHHLKYKAPLQAMTNNIKGFITLIILLILFSPLPMSHAEDAAKNKTGAYRPILIGEQRQTPDTEPGKTTASHHFPPIKTHKLASKITGQTYEIHVMLPVSRIDGSEKFPVLYMTDANGSIPISQITRTMQTSGELPRFIVVGIGYPVDTVFHSLYLRQRDLTPSTIAQMRYPIPIEGIVEVETGKKTGGAPEFLAFIQQELKPFINTNYQTIPEESGYFGISFGGLFGLYVLFHQPDTFNRYVIGSPALWWDNEITFSQARKFLENHTALNAEVYMSVGGQEEISQPGRNYVSNVYKMDALLHSKPLSGFSLKTEVFPSEGHTSVFGLFHSRGLRTVYGPVTCSPFQTEGCQ